LFVYDLFDYIKKLPFEVLQNAVREKPAKLEELTLLEVRLWLVLKYFMNGNFRECWYWAAGFSSFWTGVPGSPVQGPLTSPCTNQNAVFIMYTRDRL